MVGLKQGSTLNSEKYKTIKTFGQGSFGITYLAQLKVSISGAMGKTSTWVDVTIKEFSL